MLPQIKFYGENNFMKNFGVLMLVSAIFFAVLGCGFIGERRKDSGTTNNQISVTPEPPAKTVLKPSDINLDKPEAVTDLVEGVFSDTEIWKEKEIAVKGYVIATTSSAKSYRLKIKNDKKSDQSEGTIGCYVKEKMPGKLHKAIVSVKGKIEKIDDTKKEIYLEPCQLISEIEEKSDDKTSSN